MNDKARKALESAEQQFKQFNGNNIRELPEKARVEITHLVMTLDGVLKALRAEADESQPLPPHKGATIGGADQGSQFTRNRRP